MLFNLQYVCQHLVVSNQLVNRTALLWRSSGTVVVVEQVVEQGCDQFVVASSRRGRQRPVVPATSHT